MATPPAFRSTGVVSRSGALTFDRQGLARWLPHAAGQRVEVTVQVARTRRSLRQNARYWALLTVACEALGWGAEATQELHEAVAQELLALPPCPKTGLQRRRRTPKLNTTEFRDYTDDVARFLVQQGADLSAWDDTTARIEAETP